MLVPPAAFGARGTSLINTLRNLSLTTNLRVCLDAGDANSYDGSSQTWTDLSGNGNHFYRGTGSGSDAADPTFTGTAGRMSSGDYFGYDGGDRFTLAQSAPAWQSAMHKSGAKLSILCWNYVNNISSVAPTQNFMGVGDVTNPTTAFSCFNFSGSATLLYAIAIVIQNEAAGVVSNTRSTLLVNNNAWNMMGVALDMAAGTVAFAVNNSTETISGVSFSSPSSTDSHVPLVLGAIAADGYDSLSNGCRSAAAAIWSTALTEADFKSIYSVTKWRFGV